MYTNIMCICVSNLLILKPYFLAGDGKIWPFTFWLQMGDGTEANKEFMEQLRMQELYSQRSEDGSDPYTYTDPEDGTVYDWDHEKKAWFPKVRPSLCFHTPFTFLLL